MRQYSKGGGPKPVRVRGCAVEMTSSGRPAESFTDFADGALLHEARRQMRADACAAAMGPEGEGMMRRVWRATLRASEMMEIGGRGRYT
jgi:hypothetical protein